MKTIAVVLAAGLGKRMKSGLHKVLHPICGKPMIGHVVDTLKSIQADRVIVIVGHGAEDVQAYLGDRVEYVRQEQQLGTGHAVLQASDLIAEEEGTVVVICGDTPLVRSETLSEMIQSHHRESAAATVMTASFAQPQGFGRIIRDTTSADQIIGIVEQKDCTQEQVKIQEINAGTYCFDNRKLFKALKQVTNTNAQNEYYLTDVIDILNREQQIVTGYLTADASEAIGINDRIALAEAEAVMRKRINIQHMLNGVTIIDPHNTYIEPDVVIGQDSIVMPGSIIQGSTSIGRECSIGPQSEINDSIIGDRVAITHSVLNEAKLGNDCTVGPFAYLRPGTDLGNRVKIGDFVEVKNATLGEGAKISHLSYVGDAKVGRNVNIGCGAITVNYDGYSKNITEIGDHAFIGSNVNLIAPVKVGRGAYVVAGSTITQDVMENDMAIARQRQTNKAGYAERLRNRIRARLAGKTEDESND